MGKFDCVFIIDGRCNNVNVVSDFVISKIKGIANVVEVEDMGLKKLAYDVRGVSEGYYYIVTFKGDHRMVTEIEKRLRSNLDVLKFIVVRKDEIDD